MNAWRDMGRMVLEFRALLVVALLALLFAGVFLGSAYLARYHECRSHGFTQYYCS